MASSAIDTGADNVTVEQAVAIATEAEQAFGGPGDVERILACYDEDIVVNYAGYAEARGRDQAGALLRDRYRHISDYRLTKTVRAVSGDVACIQWFGQWVDPVTGRERAGRGLECMRLRAGKVVAWDAAFNTWDLQQGPDRF